MLKLGRVYHQLTVNEERIYSPGFTRTAGLSLILDFKLKIVFILNICSIYSLFISYLTLLRTGGDRQVYSLAKDFLIFFL